MGVFLSKPSSKKVVKKVDITKNASPGRARKVQQDPVTPKDPLAEDEHEADDPSTDDDMTETAGLDNTDEDDDDFDRVDREELFEKAHDPSKQKFPCPHPGCDKKFQWKKSLKQHERIHTGDKLQVCSVCQKKFTNRQALLRHGVVHTGAKPYQCAVCGHRFTQPNNFARHVKNRHNYSNEQNKCQSGERFDKADHSFILF